MNKIELEASLVKNLIDLCSDRGLPTTFTHEDIVDILASDSNQAEKMSTLKRIHSSLHEVLYSPPRK